MPIDPKQPRRRSWQNAGTPASGAQAKHGWQGAQQKGQATPSRGGISRRTKMTLVGTGFVVLAGGIALMIYLLIPPPELQLEFLAVSNADHLPAPLQIVGQDQSSSDEWTKVGIKTAFPKLKKDSPEEWSNWVEEFKKSKAQNLVLFISAPGSVDEEGQPYIVVDQADPTLRTHRFYVSQLLEQLRELPKASKLVILDSTQSLAYWPIGMARNDFAAKLNDKEMKEQIEKIDNLCVLCASGEGQRSWVCEAWGESVFMHYVLQGLKGDVHPGGIRGDIHADELAKYVRDKVQRWAVQNRAANQEPFLIGSRSAGMRVVRDRKYEPKKIESQEVDWESLKNAWANRDELEKESAFPCAVAPHLWREYLEMLMRYERLVLAGDSQSARSKLGDIRARIERATRLRMPSTRLTLPGTSALLGGMATTEQAALAAAFQSAWESPNQQKDDQATEFKRLYATKENNQSADARKSKVLDLLLEEGIKDDTKELSKAAEIAAKLCPDSSNRPAEIHFLMMLEANKRAKRPKDLEATALRITQMSEQAALGLSRGRESEALPAYSEDVRELIQKDVEEGDKERRLGQDLLFADDMKSFGEAASYFKQAEDKYQKAQQKALPFRQVRYARDLAMVQLPYFSHWQAALPDGEKPDLDLVATLKKLWADTHELHGALAKEKDFKKWENKAIELRKELAILNGKFVAYCENDLAKRTAQPTDWRAIEAALCVPFLPSDLRLRLVKTQASIGNHLLAEFKEDQPVEPVRDEKEIERFAERQTQLVLAMWGRDWIDQKGTGTFEDLEKYFGSFKKMDRVSRAAAMQVDDLRKTIQKGAADSRAAADLDIAEKSLAKAAHEAHRLDGAAITYFHDTDPIDEYRRLLLHNLLCWQAQRRLWDHWYGEGEGEPNRYFRFVGEGHVTDAATLLGLPAKDPAYKARQKPTDELSKRLAESGDFVAELHLRDDQWSSKETLNLAGDDLLRQRYHIGAPEHGVQEGYPVYRMKGDKWLEPPDAKQRQEWAPTKKLGEKERWQELAEVTIQPVENPRATIDPDRTSHRLEGFFRGLHFGVTTDVNLYRLPDQVTRQQRMPPAALRVQADPNLFKEYRMPDADLVIVLDTSGSMTYEKGKGQGTRYERAVDALREMLRQLPRDVHVTVRLFPTATNPNRTILNKVPWNPELIDRLRETLRDVRPEGRTPLVRTMIDALGDFRQDARSKSLLVITDGGDNEQDTNQLVNNLVKAFRNKDVQIYAVLFEKEFEPGTNEEPNSKEFEKAITGALQGKYADVNTETGLQGFLTESALRMYFTLSAQKNNRKATAYKVTRMDENPQWKDDIAPDPYFLQFSLQNRPLTERQLRMRPGDGLVVNIRSDNGRLVVERALWAEKGVRQLNEIYARRDNLDWVGAIHQKTFGDGKLQMMATLENATSRIAEAGDGGPFTPTLQQMHPRLVHFEVAEKADGKAKPLTVSVLPGYPAPTWSLDVPSWRGESVEPVVNVWWSEDERSVPVIHPSYATLLRQTEDGKDGFRIGAPRREIPPQLRPQPEDRLILESVTFEKQKIILQPGGREPQELSCLVVRLDFPAGRPYMVRLRDMRNSEIDSFYPYEHRFYTHAHKYTGIFWGQTVDDLSRGDLALELISLEAFKQQASKSRHYTFDDVGSPNRKARKAPLFGQQFVGQP